MFYNQKTHHDFIMVIGRWDDSRFKQFVTRQHHETLQTIPKTQNTSNLWAIGKSGLEIWKKIKKGDKIYFARFGSEFSHCGIVYKTFLDTSLAVNLWGDSPRIRDMKQFILFSSVEKTSQPFSQFCRKAGIKPTIDVTGLYLAKNKLSERKGIPGIIDTLDGNDGIPNRKFEVITRFVRNTAKVKKLKNKYDDKCQICGYSINTNSKSKYSEVHHIHPLGEGGDDDFGNMLVLCPNHHVEFDYKSIGVSDDTKTVIDLDGNVVGTLTLLKGHKIDAKNIQFHLSEMNV